MQPDNCETSVSGAGVRYSKSDVTRLLKQWSHGDAEALDKLMPLVFDDVREVARRSLAREGAGHTLQPTALVHEVYLRLTGCRSVQWTNRAHFLGSLAQMMRRILVDHARRHRSAKRGQGAPTVPLDDTLRLAEARHPDLTALDDALVGLAAFDQRKCQIVELQFFIGLTQTEIGEVLEMSLRSVNRESRKARMWLRRELSRGFE